MSLVSGNQLSVGLRFAQIFELNEFGRPLVGVENSGSSAGVAYTGLQLEGAKAYTLTVPQPVIISHTGDDRLLAKDVLPAKEGVTAEIKASKNRYDVRALLTNVKVGTVGEAKTIAFGTDQQGFEPQVGLLLYQQSLDSDGTGSMFGARRWRVGLVPKATCIPMPPGMEENAAEMTYTVNAFVVKNHIWGAALTDLNDGCTEMQGLEMMMEGRPWLEAWLGDGVTVKYTLTKTALSVAKIAVFKSGVEVTGADITKTTTDVTFTTAPLVTDDIDIVYEW